MKPTNKELNMLCARCMNIFVTSGGYGPQTTNYIPYRSCPDYCCDRNALNDVYNFINDSNRSTYEEFERFEELMDDSSGPLATLMTSPRQQVIAFIKATGNWNYEWSEED